MTLAVMGHHFQVMTRRLLKVVETLLITEENQDEKRADNGTRGAAVTNKDIYQVANGLG